MSYVQRTAVAYAVERVVFEYWTVRVTRARVQKAEANKAQIRFTLEQAKEQERQALYVTHFYTNTSH